MLVEQGTVRVGPIQQLIEQSRALLFKDATRGIDIANDAIRQLQSLAPYEDKLLEAES